MGKKKQRTKQVSKGERRKCCKDVVTKRRRRDYIASDGGKMINQLNAYKNNKNVMLTIPNPNKNETNKGLLK